MARSRCKPSATRRGVHKPRKMVKGGMVATAKKTARK